MGGMADVLCFGNIYEYIYIHGNKHMKNHQINTRRPIELQGAKCVGSVMTSFQKALGGALMHGKSVSGELLGLKTFTQWKINMGPTNHPFRKENDLPTFHDYVPC